MRRCAHALAVARLFASPRSHVQSRHSLVTRRSTLERLEGRARGVGLASRDASRLLVSPRLPRPAHTALLCSPPRVLLACSRVGATRGAAEQRLSPPAEPEAQIRSTELTTATTAHKHTYTAPTSRYRALRAEPPPARTPLLTRYGLSVGTAIHAQSDTSCPNLQRQMPRCCISHYMPSVPSVPSPPSTRWRSCSDIFRHESQTQHQFLGGRHQTEAS